MQGVVREIKAYRRRRYGWLFGIDGKLYHFNGNESVDAQMLKVRDRVTFDIQGEKARNVKPISM